MKKVVFLIQFFLFINHISFSQPGKDGAKTITTNTILNSYSPIVSNAAAGSNAIAVLSQATLLNLCSGDLIMIYQAQGATINTANNVSYGSINSYNSAGLYEFVYVNSVNLNTINLNSPLVNSYSSSGMTQVIKVPQYTTLTINSGFSVTPKLWKDTVVASVRYRFGGIIAVHASNIANNGIITASGAGFRGGQLDILNTSAYTSGVVNYVSTTNSDGGEKGESIAGYQPEYDILNGRFGRGAPANGGGGGNGWNAGGGGGSNGNNGNAWTGQGVMVVNASNPLAAWQLDPGYIANGNSLTNSSGGGRGGYSVGASFQNPTTTGPGNPSWSLDSRREVGGLGGRPLTNISATNRIYFGGGGGAGDENNANGGAGGTGGGIVYLIATSNVSGSGVISANGNDGFNTTGNGWDAPGGAGGGGSILIKSGAIATSQNIISNGGKGGDQFVNTIECEGLGGGGGGGFVAISVASGIVSGGTGGVTNAAIMTAFPFDGSTYGASGQSTTVANTFITYNPTSIFTATNNSSICEGATLNLFATTSSGIYNWLGPNGFSSNLQNPSINNVNVNATGIYTVTLITSGCSSFIATTTVTINQSPIVSINNTLTSTCPGQTVSLNANGANTYTWHPGNLNTLNVIVNPTTTTIYSVTGSDSFGCSAIATATINVGNTGIVSITGQSIICIGETTTLTASGANSYTWIPGNVNSNSIIVSPTTTQSYTVFSSINTCTATNSRIVIVTPFPTVSIVNTQQVICPGAFITLQASGAGSYTWYPGNYSGNPFVIGPLATQIYTVVGGTGNCTNNAVKEVTVVAQIDIDLSINSASICAGQSISITITGAFSYDWNPSYTMNSGDSFTLNPSQSTIYTVTGHNGSCASTKTISVFVSSVIAAFNDDSHNSTYLNYVNFYNLSANNAYNYWYFNNNQTSLEVNPSVLFDEPGIFLACLVVKNKYGCMDTICKEINIGCSESSIFIPNTFTPDGDGLNDIFRIVTVPQCFTNLKLTIFDRWGEKLFYSENLEEGWNGKYKNNFVKDDVYTYLIEYTLPNKKSVSKTGFVLVIKNN